MAVERRESFLVVYIVAFIAVAIAAGAVYLFWSAKQKRLEAETKTLAAQAEMGRLVATAISARGPAVRKVTLVGEALPYKTATLYAKVGGYLTRIAVDVGDRVRTGQFIAYVTSPELDAQYRGAVANLENKERLATRTRDLAEKGFYSQQSLDNAETDVKAQADQVMGIRTMQDYRTLVAPFDGVVTARFADPGALVTNATSNRTAAQPVVTISDTSKLRVTVYVDQPEAPYVKVGTEVEIADSSNADIKGTGKVSRISGQLDPKTRTMLTQVDFDNSKRTFMAGSFVTVSLLIPTKSYVEAPTGALIQRDGKSFVGVIDGDSRVKFTPIEIAGTDGKVIRIASGINEGARLVLNLPNTVSDGARVNPAPAGPAPAAAATPAAPPPGAKPPTQPR